MSKWIVLAAAFLIALSFFVSVGESKTYYLHTGDRAVIQDGETYCDVILYYNEQSFRCAAGADWRASYGVVFNAAYATLIRYTKFKDFNSFPFVVVLQRTQQFLHKG